MPKEIIFRFEGENNVNSAYAVLEQASRVKQLSKSENEAPEPKEHPKITRTYLAEKGWFNVIVAYEVQTDDGNPIGKIKLDGFYRMDGSFPHYRSNSESYFANISIIRTIEKQDQQSVDNLDKIIEELAKV